VLFLFGAKFVAISVLLIFLLNFIPIVGLLIAVLVVVILYIVTVGLSAKMGWLLLALMAECACQLYFLFSFLSL